MFNMPTSGPLSPIVSLERRKLEQQGIPPGQEQPGSAAKGSPISGDLAQLIQLNRMLQQQGTMQQQANAAPSTVAQDLMQRAGQQMQPQMQQMPPQMDPRQQGIAQLPQEAVGNGMAAGGIVAFDDGGSVRHFAGGGLTAAEQEELDSLHKLRFAGISGYGTYNLPEVKTAQDQTDKRYKELLTKKQAAEQAAKEQTQAAKVSGVLSQYGLGAPPAPAPAPAAAPAPAPPVPDDVKRVIAATRAARPSRDEGLAEFVPTLSYSKRNLHDVAIENAGFDVQKDYGKIRKKMEEESGLAGIWKKQQEEQERLKAEVSPEARKKAFYNNLAEQLAGQIGQRGVSTSSRLAQMVGAYGATRSTTDKETKKLEAELNKAANDLQEKQAMYRATGAMADREAMAKATQNYEKAALDKQTAGQQEKKDAEDRKLKERQLDLMESGQIQQGQIARDSLNARVTAASIAAAARAQMTSAQYSAVYNNAKKAVDANDGMGLARAQVAKAANMGKGKAPAPGVDQKFDGMVNKLYKQMVDEQIAASLPGGRMAGVGMGAPVPVDEE
jgi:hypothetical protein